MSSRHLKFFKKFIFPNIHTRINGDSEYWRSIIEESGGELKKTISTRGHKRGIFLLEHPSYGKCILKISCLIREPTKGLADKSIADIVAKSNPGIFPRLYDRTPSYTLEEYIDGKKFYTWMMSNNNPSAVNSYFLSLKKWSTSCAGTTTNDVLKPDEIRYLCNKYITKSLGQLQYLSNKKRLRAIYLLSRRRKKMSQQIDCLWKTADDIQFPKSMMCGDMGTKNILVDSNTSRLYNIDYEEMSMGHFGFDAAYFLSSYLTNTSDVEGYNELTKLILTEEYMGGYKLANFLRELSFLLGEIGQIVYFPEDVK